MRETFDGCYDNMDQGVMNSLNDFNKGSNHGCGYFQVTEKNGLRCSASVGYLKPIKNRSNLKILTKT